LNENGSSVINHIFAMYFNANWLKLRFTSIKFILTKDNHLEFSRPKSQPIVLKVPHQHCPKQKLVLNNWLVRNITSKSTTAVFTHFYCLHVFQYEKCF